MWRIRVAAFLFYDFKRISINLKNAKQKIVVYKSLRFARYTALIKCKMRFLFFILLGNQELQRFSTLLPVLESFLAFVLNATLY